MNNNAGTALAKIAVLTGGALLGAILANWCDKLILERAHERSEYDKSRYEQGLSSQSPPPPPVNPE